MVTWRRRENSNAFPPSSSQNLYRKRARCAENKQEELEKLMKDETGMVCMCPCCGAGVLERGPGSRAFRLPRFAVFVVGFWGVFCHYCRFFLTSFNLSIPLYFLTAAVIPTFSLLSFFFIIIVVVNISLSHFI